MKLRRVLAILTLLVFTIIPVMAQTAAAPAVVYPVTTMNGYLYTVIATDLGLFNNITAAGTTYTPTPIAGSSTPAGVVNDGLWAEADLILNEQVTAYLTAQLRYYYATTGTLANSTALISNAYPIPGILIANGTIDFNKFFGLPVTDFDILTVTGFYGTYDNAYSNVTMRGYEDVSVAGTSGNNYEWYLMPYVGFMNNTFWLKFGWTPQTYYTELGKTYDVDNDWVLGVYGTPNLGFGTLRFEVFYDAYNTNGSGNAATGTFQYAGLKSVADRLDMSKGVVQGNFRLEIPLDKVMTVWVGGGAYYDLATYVNTSYSKVVQYKWAFTGKFLMANLLDSAFALWGNSLDMLANFDTTIYALNMFGMLPNVDLCLDVKLSFTTNMYAYDTFSQTTGVVANGNVANQALNQMLQGVDVAVRMRMASAQFFVGFAMTGSYTDPATSKVYYVGTNNAGAWIYNAAVQNIGSAVSYYVPGGFYTRLYIPL